MDLGTYQQLRSGATLGLHVPTALWRLQGPDAERWLNGQITQDVRNMAPGTTRRAAVCSAKGRMQGDLSVSKGSGDCFYLAAPLSLRESLGQRLDMFLIADDAELCDITDEWSLIHIFNGDEKGTSNDRHLFVNPRFGLAGQDVWVLREDEASVPHSDDLIHLAEVLRMEHGLPQWGKELDEKTLPPEAGYDRFGISYDKGCYVGQETIARIKSIGHVNRSLCCLAFEDSESKPSPGTELSSEQTKIGRITSICDSPELGTSLALGYLKRAYVKEGTQAEAEGNTCQVIPPPLAIFSS